MPHCLELIAVGLVTGVVLHHDYRWPAPCRLAETGDRFILVLNVHRQPIVHSFLGATHECASESRIGFWRVDYEMAIFNAGVDVGAKPRFAVQSRAGCTDANRSRRTLYSGNAGQGGNRRRSTPR